MSRQRSAFTFKRSRARARASFLSSRALARTATIAALLGGLVTRNPARAYEDQLSVDLALGYGGLADADPLPAQQLAFDLGAAVGIADWLVLRGALGYGVLFDGERDLAQAGRVRLEGAYLLDVLQWVPFVGVGGGLWAIDEPGGLALRPTGHLVLGLDYLATRRWTFGVDVRTGFLWINTENRSFTEGQLRISRMFELFR